MGDNPYHYSLNRRASWVTGQNICFSLPYAMADELAARAAAGGMTTAEAVVEAVAAYLRAAAAEPSGAEVAGR